MYTHIPTKNNNQKNTVLTLLDVNFLFRFHASVFCEVFTHWCVVSKLLAFIQSGLGHVLFMLTLGAHYALTHKGLCKELCVCCRFLEKFCSFINIVSLVWVVMVMLDLIQPPCGPHYPPNSAERERMNGKSG